MPSIEIEVYCGTCGAGLCNQTEVDSTAIHVEVCDNCVEAAKTEERNEAYEEGLIAGYDDGYEARKEEEKDND